MASSSHQADQASLDPYEAVKADLRAVHWELGNTPVKYESETTERFMSENRNKILRDACRNKTTPESLQLGKLLRQSHIQLSHRPDRESAKTETKMRYVPQKIEMAKSYAETNGAELRKSNIDLAVADPKSGKEWKSVLKSTMSASEDAKFACKKPQGFQELGEELRKSSVLLHAGRHDFRSPSLPQHISESKRQFHTMPLSPTVGFSETLGKELRTSSIDVAYGAEKKADHWQSQCHEIMSNNSAEKWSCKQPEGFYHLIAELKKSNITLGNDRVIYGSEGVKRPIRDGRKDYPAGFVPGL
jgi:hypothetical protein